MRSSLATLIIASSCVLIFAFVFPQKAGASTKGVMRVTGYGVVTAGDGSSGPVTLVVTGHKRAAISNALNNLRAAPKGICAESDDWSSISVAFPGTDRPSFQAIIDDCPSPGVVSITVGGEPAAPLEADCALRKAVVAALPPGRAMGTRHDTGNCS